MHVCLVSELILTEFFFLLEDCSDDCFILFSFALCTTCLDSTVIECGLYTKKMNSSVKLSCHHVIPNLDDFLSSVEHKR